MADSKPTQSFADIINELNNAVQMKQPDDVLQFCSDFFLSKLAQKHENYLQDYKFHNGKVGKSRKKDRSFLTWRDTSRNCWH